MADDIVSALTGHVAEISVGGALLSISGWLLRLGRQIGAFERGQKAQDDEIKRLDAADVKRAVELAAARAEIDERLAAHHEQMTEIRVGLGRIPDRDEIRAMHNELRQEFRSRPG